MGIHQCLPSGKKRLRNASLLVHGIEAENAVKIGEKKHFVPYNLWGKE
jgi:hypothetical protein